MKKNVILVVVILAAVLVGLKYFASKEQASTTGPGAVAQSESPVGVALPDDAKGSQSGSMESVYVPTQSLGSYDTLTLPDSLMSLKGACEAGSPKEMMANHGKTWGYFTGRRIAFTFKKTQEMYDFVSDYYACVAAARQDTGFCDSLPGEVAQNELLVPPDISPLGVCREKIGVILFRAYVAGKAKDRRSCMGFLSTWDSQSLAKISPPDFCNASAAGPEKLMAYIKDRFPEDYADGAKDMGFFKKDCAGDQACLSNYAIWEGIRTSNPAKCPAPYVPHCSALAKGIADPCTSIIMKMSGKYCGYYKDLVKAGHGYAGMTPDEVKEEIRQVALKKAEEDRQRKELEKTGKEINTRVKKLMGSQGE